MKSIYSELKRIKSYIEDKITEEDFRMLRPPSEDDETAEPAAVNPKVIIGNMPHSNFSVYGPQDDRFYQAPYILVGYERAGFHPNDEEVDILVQVCAYTSENYENEEETDVDFPDNMGVLDVTEVLERIMAWIREGSTFPAGMDFEIGNYGTQAYTYPYNFGYISFQLKSSVGQMPRKALF